MAVLENTICHIYACIYTHICIYTHTRVCVCAYFLTLTNEGAQEQQLCPTSISMITPSAQILTYKIFHFKEIGLVGEMADSRARKRTK